MKAFGIAIGLGIAALISGCGGGGGSPGDTTLEYKITLRADKTKLPINIGGQGPSIGTNAPYTTVLHVDATEGGKPIIGTKDAFACNVDAGLTTGALYYLDGKSEHETDDNGVKRPNAYRSVVLDSNSGGNSFHFHAGETRGNARITCTITNPRDNQVSSASVVIAVGDGLAPAAGMPSTVLAQAASGYLGARNNIGNVPNTVSLQAMIRDEVGQDVAGSPSTPNLQVYIQGGSAAAGARLSHNRQTGTVIMTNTDGSGVANFALTSGVQRGVIVLVMVTDRADNNVSNGIQDPVTQRMAIPVVNGIAQKPLAVADQTVTATCNQQVSTALVATEGLPPYTWSAVSPLPAGLQLSPDGLVTGVPVLPNGAGAGSYGVVVRVTDDNGTSVTSNLTVTVDAGDCKPLKIGDSSVAISKGVAFAFALSAEGGKPPYVWKAIAGLPSGVTLSEAGILQGTVTTVGKYMVVVEVTDADGVKVVANMTIDVTDPDAPTTPTPTP